MQGEAVTARADADAGAGADASGEAARIEALLDALAETRQELAALHARETVLLDAALKIAVAQREREPSPGGADIPVRSMAAQIAACLRVSDRTVQQRLDAASILVTRFPTTLAALSAGVIDRAHANVIVDAGLGIDDDPRRAEYEAAAVTIAQRESPGRLRPAVRALAHRLHPIPLSERHRTAATRRGVWVRDGDDGMADLIATLPATIAHGIHDRLTGLARHNLDNPRAGDGSIEMATSGASETAAPDSRKLGEVRADVLSDLLLTGHATTAVTAESTPVARAIVAQVQLTVPVLTLLDTTGSGTETTDPTEIMGRSPIDPDTARALAAHAPGWDRVLTHPVTGAVIATDRYRPTDQQRRALRARDEHCRFPGCRMPTRRCDIDHTIAAEHDGPTDLRNLAHLCRRHHTLKHHSAWRVRQTPDGTLHWTSPTGRTYPDTPARSLTFTTAPDLSPSAPDLSPSAPDPTPSVADPPPF